jgi:hypothetical protein
LENDYDLELMLMRMLMQLLLVPEWFLLQFATLMEASSNDTCRAQSSCTSGIGCRSKVCQFCPSSKLHH